MSRLTIAMKIGFVWAIISFLIGCAQTQECAQTPEWIYPNKDSQNKKIEQLTAKLKKSQQANLALKKENKTLKTDKLRLMNTNRNLKKDNLELTMKINILKILDHRVEEKRKNYSSE